MAPPTLARKINEKFHGGACVRSLSAVYKRADILGVARRQDERPAAIERREVEAEVMRWDRERRGRATVKTPAVAGVTREMLMRGRA